VEQFGAGSGAERVQACPELAFELVGTHCRSLRRREASPGRMYGRVIGLTRPGVGLPQSELLRRTQVVEPYDGRVETRLDTGPSGIPDPFGWTPKGTSRTWS
jgi:hypothetical protein